VIRVAFALLLAASAVCSVLLIHDAAVKPKTYTSGYDSTDPGVCANPASAVAIVRGGAAPLLDATDTRIGTIRLRRSERCETIWSQVLLTAQAAKTLKGRVVEITMLRPADNRLAPYALELKGGREGFGNQLAATACVQGMAQLLPGGGQSGGPSARTQCRT
jgi:hypothetical protein